MLQRGILGSRMRPSLFTHLRATNPLSLVGGRHDQRPYTQQQERLPTVAPSPTIAHADQSKTRPNKESRSVASSKRGSYEMKSRPDPSVVQRSAHQLPSTFDRDASRTIPYVRCVFLFVGVQSSPMLQQSPPRTAAAQSIAHVWFYNLATFMYMS